MSYLGQPQRNIRLTRSEIFSGFNGALSTQPNHPLTGIDCLITANLGNGMNKRLTEDGIKTIATNTTDPDGAVISFLKYV